jgi:hypothetical protein
MGWCKVFREESRWPLFGVHTAVSRPYVLVSWDGAIWRGPRERCTGIGYCQEVEICPDTFSLQRRPSGAGSGTGAVADSPLRLDVKSLGAPRVSQLSLSLCCTAFAFPLWMYPGFRGFVTCSSSKALRRHLAMSYSCRTYSTRRYDNSLRSHPGSCTRCR